MPASRRQRQVANVTRHRQMTDTIRQLQEHTQSHLTDQEQLRLFSAISNYQAQHNVTQLVEQLVPLLNTPAKKQLLRHIRFLVLQGDLVIFDKLLVVHRLWPPTSPVSHSQAPPGTGLRQTVNPQHIAIDRQPVALQQPDSPQRSKLQAPLKVVIRPGDNGALGFDIRGGAEHGLGIFISSVEEGSQASEKGLEPGQLVLKANGVDFDKITYEQAVEVLTRVSGTIKKVRLTVLPSGQYPSEAYPLVQYYWLDSLHRPTSPPPEYKSGANLLQPVIQLPPVNTRKISMAVDSTQRVGLSIRGGVEHGLGIYVSHIEPGTVADNYSIKVGDQILDVNGLNCNTMLHDEAADILASNDVLVMTLRSIDKIPIRPITPMDSYRNSWSPHHASVPQKAHVKRSATVSGYPMDGPTPAPSRLQRPQSAGAASDIIAHRRQSPAVHGSLERRQLRDIRLERASGSFDTVDSVDAVFHDAPENIPATKHSQSFGGQTVWKQPYTVTQTVNLGQRNTEAAIRKKINAVAATILNVDEMQTLNYYLDQYTERNLSIKQLVLALSTLLDIKEKRKLLNEIRSAIGSRDVDRYDELVMPLLAQDMTVRAHTAQAEPKSGNGQAVSRKPPPPARKDSLIDYAAFGASSFGHDSRVDAASDSENSDVIDSPTSAFSSTMATRSSTLNSEVTFASPPGSLLPNQGVQMQQQLKLLHEQDDEGHGQSSTKLPKSIPNHQLLSPPQPQLRVYEEEFGESPNPQRRTTPKIIKSSADDEDPSTIPVGHLRPTNTNQSPMSTLEREQQKGNPEFMLAQSLVSRRAQINPGSINGVPRSVSMDSTASGLTLTEEAWEEDDDTTNPNPQRRTSGQHLVSRDHIPSTITEEKETGSPSVSPAAPRRRKPGALAIESPTKNEVSESPSSTKRTPDKRPPSPTTAMNTILSLVKEPPGQPSPKMPRRQVLLPEDSPKDKKKIGSLQPIPLPRSPSQQAVESPPQPLPRKSLPESPLVTQMQQESPVQIKSDDTDEEPEDLSPTNQQQDSDTSSWQADEETTTQESTPAHEVPHAEADSGDLYAIPEKSGLQQESSTESNSDKPPEDPSKSGMFAEAAKAQKSVTEVEVAGSSNITGQVHSVRPGKTFAGYTGLHGDIKTILIEKTQERLGIAVTGGSNTRQKEVRIREITPTGAAATCGALRLGMQILAVDGKTLKGLPHMQAVMVIKQAYDSSRLRLEMIVHVDDSVV